MSTVTSTEAQILGSQIGHLRQSVERVEHTLAKMDETLNKLVKVEWRQEEQSRMLKAAETAIADHEERLQPIERDMPSLREHRGWFIAGVIGIFALSFLAFLNGNLVLRPAAAQTTQVSK